MSTSTAYVLDASVLVTRVRRSEQAHRDVSRLLTALVAANCKLFIPTIALAEVGAALARSGSSAKYAYSAASALQQIPHLQIVAVDTKLGQQALEIAVAQSIRGCDAIYVALAQAVDATLITLDREQRERTPISLLALTPADALARYI